MIEYSLRSDSPSGKGSSWKIISTNKQYQLTIYDQLDDVEKSEVVMCGKEEITGYMFCMIPSETGYYVQLVDQSTNSIFISNQSFKIEDACGLITSLNSLSLEGIRRVWKSKKLSRNLTIINNKIDISFRVDKE